MEHYGLTNVDLIEGIVWSETEQTGLTIEGNPAGGRKETKHDVDRGFKVVQVQAWKLDDVLPTLNVDRIDLLCSDVEGAELEMVKGASDYFSQKKVRNVAIAAYHDSATRNELISLLNKYGYKDVIYNGNIPQYGGIIYAHL